MKRSLFELQGAFADLFAAPQGEASGEFRRSVRPGGTLSIQGALDVYRAGYYARLTEALGATFEAVWWVLGDELFFEACRRYIASHPSHFYSLSDYGDAFPDFLAASGYSEDLPFLAELAGFEWRFKDLFHAREDAGSASKVDLASLARGADGVLELAASCLLVRTRDAVHAIWRLRRTPQGDCTLPDWRHAEHLFLYKRDHDVVISELDAAQFETLEGIQAGRRLGEVLGEVGGRHPQFGASAVSAFFQTLFAAGVVRGFRPA